MAIQQDGVKEKRRPLGEFSGVGGGERVNITLSQKAALFGFPVSSDINYQVTVVEDTTEGPYLEVRPATGEE